MAGAEAGWGGGGERWGGGSRGQLRSHRTEQECRTVDASLVCGLVLSVPSSEQKLLPRAASYGGAISGALRTCLSPPQARRAVLEGNPGWGGAMTSQS